MISPIRTAKIAKEKIMKKQKKDIILTEQIAKMIQAKTRRDWVLFLVGIFVSVAIALICIRMFTDLLVQVVINFPQQTIEYSSYEDIIAQLTSMQANTLSIVSIFLTVAATILGFLSFSQWQQTKKLQKQYEDMNYRVQNLFSLAVVQSLSEEQYYIRANMVLAEELKRLRNTGNYDNGTILFSGIQMLLAIEKEAIITSKMEAFTETEKTAWESVVDLCTQILEIPYAHAAIRYLVQIKYIYAKWQLCRITRQTNREQSLIYINDAQKMLERISESEMDPYGHICNLRGLVLLWNCKCLEDNSKYNDISKYAEKYRKAAMLFEEAINEAKIMSPKGDHSVFQNHLGVAQINELRCVFFDYYKRENYRSNWNKEMCESLDQAANTYYILVKNDSDYGKAYLNLASICCYCLRFLLEDKDSPVFLLSSIFSMESNEELSTLFINAQKLLRCAFIKGVALPDIGYKMFEIAILEQASFSSKKTTDILSNIDFLKKMNSLAGEVIVKSNVSSSYLKCRKKCKKERNTFEYQSFTEGIKYQKIDEFLVAILKYYRVINDECSDSAQSLQNVDLTNDTPVIGFLEPWRNYAYWRFETSKSSEEKKRWKDAAVKLNLKLKKYRKLQAESWEKSTGCE